VVSALPAGVLDPALECDGMDGFGSSVAKISTGEPAKPSTVIKTSLMTALASAESCRASRRSASEDAARACIAPARSPSWMAVVKAARQSERALRCESRHGDQRIGAKCPSSILVAAGRGLGPMTRITGGSSSWRARMAFQPSASA
jgi:hypothetical protein